MASTTIGDMSLHFQSLRHGAAIKNRLNGLTQELGTGRPADLTRHLGGDRVRFADITRQLGQIGEFARAARETGQMLGAMQLALSTIDGTRNALAGQLLPIGEHSSTQEVEAAIHAGRITFDNMARALNTRFAEQNLFSGAATDRPALAPPGEMIAAISIAVAGATDAAAVRAALDTWFDTPGGGFATLAYAGDTGPAPQRRIDGDTVIVLDARADDPALRDLLKGAAMAAIADTPGLAISDADRRQLLQDAGRAMLNAGDRLIGLQARLGHSEAVAEATAARLAARKTAYGIIHNDLALLDPLDTATEIKQVELQLETHYTLTDRLSRLSLLRYLR